MNKKVTTIVSICMIALVGIMTTVFAHGLADENEYDRAKASVTPVSDEHTNGAHTTRASYQPRRSMLMTQSNTAFTTAISSVVTTTDTTLLTTESTTTTTAVTTTEPVTTTTFEEPTETYTCWEDTNTGPYYYYDDWLWVGDSRTVGMSACVGCNSFAKSSMGLAWFLDNAETIYSYRYHTVIINLGVNDLGNAWNYVDVFNSMPDEFIESNCIYIMSVNPVDEALEYQCGYSVQNSSIEWFNDVIRENIREDIYFIDTYNYLWNIGFTTADGLHYNYNSYVDIYNYMVTTIQGGDPY